MSDLKIEPKGQVVIIGLPRTVDTDTITKFVSRTPGLALANEKLVILNFDMVESLDLNFSPAVSTLVQALKKKNRVLCSTGLSPTLLSQLTSCGLDAVFCPKSSLEEAMKFAGLNMAKATLDVGFINPFIKATLTTLQVQANTKVTTGKLYIKKQQTLAYQIDIAGVLSMNSNVFNGSIAICFPERIFLTIYSNMMMVPSVDKITSDIEDAAGEILNIIYGLAKSELNDNNHYHIQKAIPTVVRGGALTVHHLSRNITMVIPFECEAGPFHLEISFDPI